MSPTIETDRLRLRPWQADDAAALVRILSVEDVYTQLGDEPQEPLTDVVKAREAIEKWTARAVVDRFDAFRAIELVETGEVVGCILLARLDRIDGGYVGEHEIGWWLHPDAWGVGYALEAARAVLDHAFAHGLGQVWCGMFEDNVRSRRVAEKLRLPYLGIVDDPWYQGRSPLFHVTADGWESLR